MKLLFLGSIFLLPLRYLSMDCSTYLSVPTLESLAHSSSSSSSTSSRSSFSLFDADPQGSDSQTDVSPHQSPEVLPLKFLPDHVSRLGLDATPKQRLFIRGNGWLNKSDDMGYDSEHESCIGTGRKDRLKVLTRKRGVLSRYQDVEVTSSTSDVHDACELPIRDVCLLNVSLFI
jgi:hypothetical protein